MPPRSIVAALAGSRVGSLQGWRPGPGSGPGARSRRSRDRARTEAEARGQAAEADRLVKQGDFAAALPFYRAERASRAALGDLRYEAYAARAIGCCHERLGDFDAAIEAWTAAIALDARRQDRGFEGYDWLLIGNVEFRRQRSREALEALSKAVPLLGDGRRSRARGGCPPAARQGAAQTWGGLSTPRPHLDRVLELADALDDPKRRTDAWAQLGSVALETEEPDLAVEWLERRPRRLRRARPHRRGRGGRPAPGGRLPAARPARRGAGPGRGRRRRAPAARRRSRAWPTTSNSSPPSRPTPRTCPRHGRWPSAPLPPGATATTRPARSTPASSSPTSRASPATGRPPPPP